MVREREIARGKRAIKDLLGRFGQKGIRYHRNAAEDDLQRLRALEGLCGNCERVKVKVVKVDRRMRTVIDCKAAIPPLNLYYNTPMGEDPDCPDFTPRR